MSSSAPKPPDFNAAAMQQADASQANTNAQTMANRPNQANPYATSQWTQGPDGSWQQSSQFTGPLGGLNANLQQQAAQAMSQPFSLSGLPQMQSGEGARNQAIDAAYGQASSRLNPQWDQREDQMRTRLLNQGLTEGSAAYQQAMGSLGQQRNDAYTSAMNMAIGQGTAAGDSVFRNSLMGRQQGLAEALRTRGQAMSELQGMNPLLGQSGFQGAGRADTPQFLAATGMQDAAAMQRAQLAQQNQADWMGAIGGLIGTGGSLAMLACDERFKEDVVRLPAEVLPGVPLATWTYRPEHGGDGRRFLGVIAQDLERVRPDAVTVGEDGMRYVSPEFAAKELSDD